VVIYEVNTFLEKGTLILLSAIYPNSSSLTSPPKTLEHHWLMQVAHNLQKLKPTGMCYIDE
jgi:hypothetical protein